MNDIRPDPLITLTTDFGQTDWFVGAMKGAILSVCPRARIVDISHGVTRHDVREAALVLLASVPHFPADTVHVAVVDPGVGGGRRAVAVQTHCAMFVAPDNGILSYVLEEDPCVQAVSLEDMCRTASPTFHGRDVFGPAAGIWAAGTPIESLGPLVSDLEVWPRPRPTQTGPGTWRGEILHVDSFGNLVTSFGPEMVEPVHRCLLEGRVPRWTFGEFSYEGLARTYSDVQQGEILVLWGSLGFVEISVRQGSAATFSGLSRGNPISLQIPVA